MHPKMMIALGNEVERERARELPQARLRSLALQQRRTRATTSQTRIPAQGSVRRLLVVP